MACASRSMISALTRLDWLECDELKIDATLVRGIEYSEERRCVVESLVTLAHAHGMTALAEGVETEAALDALTELGCDRAQGFLIAQPVAAAAFGDCARRWEARACRAVASGERQLLLPGLGYDSGEVLEAIA